MRNTLKSLAIAVAAVGYSMSGVASGKPPVEVPETSIGGLGDMAIVPYYTVRSDYVTGLHIINTSDATQVVKLRLRRATDSMDALDFNLIMSPKDEWTGYLTNEEGVVTFNSNDTTCTAPEGVNGKFPMPGLYSKDADTGYIEVIGMGSATSDQPISVAAEHVNGVPANCDLVRSNFFANNSVYNKPSGDTSKKGVLNSVSSNQTNPLGGVELNSYGDTGNVLKVSYFIRDAAAGTEFGSGAVTFANFLQDASITNQQAGLFSGDLQGFDFPDLNGGAPLSSLEGIGASRGKYEGIRAAIGGASAINDWSANTAAGIEVGTDWVVTLPGQYTMLDLPKYIDSLVEETPCIEGCDNRDMPLTASFSVFDREERGIVEEEGGLVISPSIPGEIQSTLLDQEVNVIEWGVTPVLDALNPVSVGTPTDSKFGWAELAVRPTTVHSQSICDFTGDPETPVACEAVIDANAIPMVGFVAWERKFDSNPAANYGRITDHSYTTTSD